MMIDFTPVVNILLPCMEIFNPQHESAFYALCTSALIGLVSTLFVLLRKKSTSKQSVTESDWSSLFNDAEAEKPGTSAQSQATSTELRNVFNVKQTPPRLQESPQNESDKPFKSSYYYAHNNPNAIGGYKDGLKAEDYVMNEPRLLKKTTAPKQTSKMIAAAQAASSVKNGSIPINRYMWDDSGNSDGIAKIIIDNLPSSDLSSTFIRWEESGIVSKEDVKAKLIGVWKNGLIIQIRKNNNQLGLTRYHLYVPRLFGEVSEVKLILKKKKLIVKLYKKKDKENLRAWPQLPSKVSSLPENKSFEEDLFVD